MKPRGMSAALGAEAPNGGIQQMGLVRPDADGSNEAASGGGLQLLVMRSQTIGKLKPAPKAK